MQRAEAEQKIADLETRVDRLERIAIALADATAQWSSSDGEVFADAAWKDAVRETAKMPRAQHRQGPC